MPAHDTDPRGVAGIGIDIVENRRVEEALARHGNQFRNRVFLKSEQNYCDQKASPALHYASRFAVKEAVAKAFGTGIGAKLGWLDIEVVRDGGAPAVLMLGKGAELARKMNIDRIYISLSHTHQYAAATALLCSEMPAGARMIAVTSAQMRELDRRTIEETGVPQEVLMDRAGHAVADHIRWAMRAAGIRKPFVRFLAGPGNNGGDAIVAARYLQKRGYRTDVWTFGRRKEPQDISVRAITSDTDWQAAEIQAFVPDIIVDGLLGTGSKGPPRGLLSEAVRWIQKMSESALIVAIDIPTGFDADTGIASEPAVRADFTVTLGAPKTGLLNPEALPFVGSLEAADIGIPGKFFSELPHPGGPEMICADDLRPLFKRRPCDAHKGSFGHALVIGGAAGYSGAISMSARAAVNSGAGLVSAAVPESIVPIVASACPEAMVHPAAACGTLLNKCSAVLIGPGLGTEKPAKELVLELLRSSAVPVTLDADAINVLAGHPELIAEAKCPVVITPHPGELGRLLHLSADDIQKDRPKACRNAAAATGAVVVLKGAGTLISTSKGEMFININGNPGMATGGAGDVLAGLLAGLLAQGFSPLDAARAAVWIHGKAGDAAALRQTQTSLSAGNIIRALPMALRRLTAR